VCSVRLSMQSVLKSAEFILRVTPLPPSVTDRRDPHGCETSRLPHFLDNRLVDGGEVVSLTRRPPFSPQEDSWYSFQLQAESTSGRSRFLQD
jgi:hypothetical protein